MRRRPCPPPPAAAAILLLLHALAPAAAQQPVTPDPGADPMVSVGVIAVPQHNLYDGRLYLQTGGRVHGASYVERAAAVVGVRAGVTLNAGSAGRIGLTLFGMRGNSTGDYLGLDGPATATRPLDVAGAEMAWQPSLVRVGAMRVRLPFGPSVVWQRLRLSEGHRDIYADPEAFPPPDVDWSDRTWLSIGGHGGVLLELRASRDVSFVVAGRGRLLFNRGGGSWAGQEERDIHRSTGRTVNISYENLIVTQAALEAGLEWRL